MFDIVQFLKQWRKSSCESLWRNLTTKTTNVKTVKIIAIQTGCLLMSVRRKQTREAIHINLFFCYLDMVTYSVLAFERNLTMGNGFIKVSRSCHAMKTQSSSHTGAKKKKKKENCESPLTKLGLNAAKYLPSRLRGKP